MLGVELTLFIIIGAIAILAAVMMLVSENAVHSALFLILNFACVAFFYLMLNAPFLAMIQVTVYAGAIMVLFLFVIMLLGAEKLTPDPSPKFPWLTPVAIGLTLIFLLVASIAIIQSEIDTFEPEPDDPLLRVVHAVSEAGSVDVYLDGELAIEELEFRHASEYAEYESGEYTASVYAHGADPATTEPVFETSVFLGGDDAISLVVMPDIENGGLLAKRVEGSLEALEEDEESQLTVVHAMPCVDSGTECAVDVADITVPSDDPYVLIEDLDYGEISALKTLLVDEYVLGIFPAGEVEAAIDAVGDEGEVNIEPITEIGKREIEANHSLLWVVMADTRGELVRPMNLFIDNENFDRFGSGQILGKSLFTTYMLPFQAIALLLLVAMVGVIVLTNPLDGSKPERIPRKARRMASVPGNPTVEEYRKMLKDGTNPGAGD